jgi:NuA3 HAT complex component NTO1
VQKKLEERYYTTTLAFAHDLCEAINVGINTASRASITSAQSQADNMQISPSKGGLGEAGVKKRLAKRIFQYVKPALLAALRAERDVSKKNIDTLVKELEGMIEASLEIRQPSITVSSAGVDMIPDAPEDPIVEVQVAADPSADLVTADATEAGPATAQGAGGVDTQPGDAIMAEPSHPLSTADHQAMGMDTTAKQTAQAADRVRAELITSPIKASMPVNGLPSASASVVGEGDPEAVEEASTMKATVTPTASSATAFPPPNEVTAGTVPSVQINGSSALPPLTPPQSHGSLNFSHAQSLGASAGDVLSEGGIPWYLKSFELQGTTAVEEKWPGRDALRSLSEELTDMDDEDLKDLGFDVDDEGGTIMAVSAHDGEVERQKDDVEEEVEVTPRGSRRIKANGLAVLNRKTRSGQLASGNARKGLRSAGRRR